MPLRLALFLLLAVTAGCAPTVVSLRSTANVPRERTTELLVTDFDGLTLAKVDGRDVPSEARKNVYVMPQGSRSLTFRKKGHAATETIEAELWAGIRYEAGVTSTTKNFHVFRLLPTILKNERHDALLAEIKQLAAGSREAHDALKLRGLGVIEPIVVTMNKARSRDDRDDLVVSLIVSFGAAAVEPLTQSLPRLTLAEDIAIEALGLLGDRRAVDPILEVLARPQLWHLDDIAVALERLGDQRAVPKLLEVYSQNHYNKSVIHALASLGDCRAVAPLAERLLDPKTQRADFGDAMASAIGHLGAKGCDVQAVTSGLRTAAAAAEPPGPQPTAGGYPTKYLSPKYAAQVLETLTVAKPLGPPPARR